MTARPTIACFLKAPLLGQVKTRLAADVGKPKALAIYRQLVESQMRRLPRDWACEIHFSPLAEGPLMRSWLGDAGTYYPQCDGGLGERLDHGIRGAFSRGASIVAAIGGDCPELGASQLQTATKLLEFDAADVVLGPATDGGYYTIVLKQHQPELFHDIPWSQPNTLAATRKRAEKLGLRYHLLEQLSDIDTVEDWNRVVR